MLETVSGFVHQVKYGIFTDAAFWIGPTPSDTTIYFILFYAGDDAATTAFKTSMVDGLSAAMFGGKSVTLIVDSTAPTTIGWAMLNPA